MRWNGIWTPSQYSSFSDQLYFLYGRFLYSQFLYRSIFIRSKFIRSDFIQSKFIQFKIYTGQNLYGSKFIQVKIYTYSSKFILFKLYTVNFSTGQILFRHQSILFWVLSIMVTILFYKGENGGRTAAILRLKHRKRATKTFEFFLIKILYFCFLCHITPWTGQALDRTNIFPNIDFLT
jgi:hypothetical protein